MVYKNCTHLDKIKEMMKLLVYLPIEIDNNIPFIVHHPYSTSNCVSVNENNHSIILDILKENDADRWRTYLINYIDKLDDVYRLFMMIEKPYKLLLLRKTYMYIDSESLGNLIRDIWVSVEYSNNDANMSTNKMLNIMKTVSKLQLMGDANLDLYNKLPDMVDVYRGVTKHNVKNISKSISWTIDLNVAKWFAKRFNLENPEVYHMQINKKDIVAVFDDRNESEVICSPKHAISGVQLYESLY